MPPERPLRSATAALTLMATTVAALIVAAAPSQADTATFRDPTGDAPARFDLGRVQVTNSGTRITVTSAVRRLRPGGTQIVGVGITPARGGAYYSLHSVRRPGGRVSATLTRYGSDGEAVKVACRASNSWRVGDGRIILSLPRTCVDEVGTIRVNVMMGPGDGSSGDPADWTKSVQVGQT